MRNPARIDEVILLLHATWILHDQQRLGQLISNVVAPIRDAASNDLKFRGAASLGDTMWAVEDDVLLARLKSEWPTHVTVCRRFSPPAPMREEECLTRPTPAQILALHREGLKDGKATITFMVTMAGACGAPGHLPCGDQ